MIDKSRTISREIQRACKVKCLTIERYVLKVNSQTKVSYDMSRLHTNMLLKTQIKELVKRYFEINITIILILQFIKPAKYEIR